MSDQLPKLFHPDHKQNNNPDLSKRKTLTPCNQKEMEALMRMGWKVVEEGQNE